MHELCFKLFDKSEIGNAQTDLCAQYCITGTKHTVYFHQAMQSIVFCLRIVLFSWKYATRIRGDYLTFLLSMQFAPLLALLQANIGKTHLPATHREVGCVSLRLNTAIQITTNSLHELYFRLPYADYSMTP